MSSSKGGKALAKSQGTVKAATFNFGFRNPVTKKSLITKVAEQMVDLMSHNNVICAQEMDGIVSTLDEVATGHGWGRGETFEGITTYYSKKVVMLVNESLHRIWPFPASSKADWRRLLCTKFKMLRRSPLRMDGAPPPRVTEFLICNNHTHDGEGKHQAGNNKENFKHGHLKHCLSLIHI